MYSMKSLTSVNLRNLVTELNRSLSALNKSTAALMVSNDLSLCMNRGSESNLHRQGERDKKSLVSRKCHCMISNCDLVL